MNTKTLQGILILRYAGEEYPIGDCQKEITCMAKEHEDPYFEFDFSFPQSPTVEKVVFGFNEENKKRTIHPFNLQYLLIGENDWILCFDIIEEFEDNAEYFSAYARFKGEMPTLTKKRVIDLS